MEAEGWKLVVFTLCVVCCVLYHRVFRPRTLQFHEWNVRWNSLDILSWYENKGEKDRAGIFMKGYIDSFLV